MSVANSYLLQIWQDERGVWAVLKQEDQLYQFENLDALGEFLKNQVGEMSIILQETPRPARLNPMVVLSG